MLGRNTKIRIEELPVKSDITIKDIGPKVETDLKDAKQQLLKEKRSRSLNQVDLISSLSAHFAGTLELNDFILKILRTLLEALPRIDRTAVLLQKEDKKIAQPFAVLTRHDQNHRFPPFDKQIIRRTLEEKKPIFVPNAGDKGLPGLALSRNTVKIKSVAAVPIKSDSKTHGVLYVDGMRAPCAFREEDFTILKILSNYAATALANHKTDSNLFPMTSSERPAYYGDSKFLGHRRDNSMKFWHREQKKAESPGFSDRHKLSPISFLSKYIFFFAVTFLLVYYSPILSGLINGRIPHFLSIPTAPFLANLPYGMILAVPFFFFGILAILRNVMSSYEVSNDGIRLLEGTFVRKEYHLAFQDFDDISFKQNLFEAPFRAGTLILKSGRGGELRMKGIHNVEGMVDLIRRKRQVERSPYYGARH
ncbi:MAG: GAF domain-containing protein [Deltaproteobacteria bacterium]